MQHLRLPRQSKSLKHWSLQNGLGRKNLWSGSAAWRVTRPRFLENLFRRRSRRSSRSAAWGERFSLSRRSLRFWRRSWRSDLSASVDASPEGSPASSARERVAPAPPAPERRPSRLPSSPRGPRGRGQKPGFVVGWMTTGGAEPTVRGRQGYGLPEARDGRGKW